MKNRIIIPLLILMSMNSCIKQELIKVGQNTSPETLNDGWRISTPDQEGINESLLGAATAYFFSESNLLNSKALLIVKNNKLVYEAYSRDLNDRNQLQNIKSVTKSITSIVTGIAIKEGVIDSNLNRTVYSYIPENFDNIADKRLITIENCLRMTTGLADPFYVVNSVLPGNSITTSLGVDLIHSPGSKYEYNNGSGNIIGGVISHEAKLSYYDYVKSRLFTPLGIKEYHWIKHSDGRVNPAFDLFLKPRDIAKFGQFCLQNGSWNEQQITPPTWIAKSTSQYENGFDGKFGYHWWINDKYKGYYANGHGGQRVFVFPDKDLVIIHLAEPSTDDTDTSEITVLLDLIMKAM